MTKQLKFTSLLLIVTSISFAQQSIVITTRSNIKDRVVALDSAKKTVLTPEQARTAQVNPPISGIGVVVKKNPGSGASRLGITNDKGELELRITEKGDHTFTLSNISGAVTTNNNIAARSQGGPVKGVKVGLGKNPPGGATSFAITNDNGEAEFKNLEVGNYKIVVQQADRATSLPKTQGF